jgi:hypothetical protein
MKTFYDYGDMLSAIRTIRPDAHIAGGAVRDTMLGREIRTSISSSTTLTPQTSRLCCAPSSST